MLVQNREGDIRFYIKVNTVLGHKVHNMIVGKKTGEGFFFCINKNGRFFLNPSLLPEEDW